MLILLSRSNIILFFSFGDLLNWGKGRLCVVLYNYPAGELWGWISTSADRRFWRNVRLVYVWGRNFDCVTSFVLIYCSSFHHDSGNVCFWVVLRIPQLFILVPLVKFSMKRDWDLKSTEIDYLHMWNDT